MAPLDLLHRRKPTPQTCRLAVHLYTLMASFCVGVNVIMNYKQKWLATIANLYYCCVVYAKAQVGQRSSTRVEISQAVELYALMLSRTK